MNSALSFFIRQTIDKLCSKTILNPSTTETTETDKEREGKEMKAHVSKNQRKWIKAKSGNVYVCPVNALPNPETATEEELKAHCLDDSRRPDNY
jgi:hypothetical protein